MFLGYTFLACETIYNIRIVIAKRLWILKLTIKSFTIIRVLSHPPDIHITHRIRITGSANMAAKYSGRLCCDNILLEGVCVLRKFAQTGIREQRLEEQFQAQAVLLPLAS